MLILTKNRAVNLSQVFTLLVESQNPAYLNVKGMKKIYSLRAYHSGLRDSDDNPDCVEIKSYCSQEEAAADLKMITEAYAAGMRVVNLR